MHVRVRRPSGWCLEVTLLAPILQVKLVCSGLESKALDSQST